MAADITAIVGKISHDLSLKRLELIKPSLKPEFRFCIEQIMNLHSYCLGTI